MITGASATANSTQKDSDCVLGNEKFQKTYKIGAIRTICCYFIPDYGLFILPDTGFGTDSNLDSKPDDYIVLCRICSHCINSDLDPYPDSDLQLLPDPFLGWIPVPRLG